MFQFPGFASHTYGFSARYRISGGFPHSDIFGSKFARNSPKLFAACHVLHRLSAPRHPPNALMTLDRRHSVQGQAAPHNGLLLAVKYPQNHQTASSAVLRSCVPHPIHPVKQQSQLPRTSAQSSLPQHHRDWRRWWSRPGSNALCGSIHPLVSTLACLRQSMVEPTGIECAVRFDSPARLNPRLPAAVDGGADRDRTGDLKLAKLALSQLSYGPVLGGLCSLPPTNPGRKARDDRQ